jgi:hypothetical protein
MAKKGTKKLGAAKAIKPRVSPKLSANHNELVLSL